MKFRAISLILLSVLAGCQSLPSGGPALIEHVSFVRARHFETGEPVIGARVELESRSSQMICLTLPRGERNRSMQVLRSLDPEIADVSPLHFRNVLGGPSFLTLHQGGLFPFRVMRVAPGERVLAFESEALVPTARYRLDLTWAAAECPDELVEISLYRLGQGADRPATIIAEGPNGLVVEVPAR